MAEYFSRAAVNSTVSSNDKSLAVKFSKFKRLESQLAALTAEMNEMKSDTDLQEHLEFEFKLSGLLKQYGMSVAQAVKILNLPASSAREERLPRVRASVRRTASVYTNPHTGEVVITKGGNHVVLRKWRAQYGSDEVRSWTAK